MRRRLDAELVRRGLATSRAGAVEAVTQGRVLVAGAPATSPARQVAADEPIALSAPDAPFVSRGGRKLDAALAAFAVDPTDRWCVDVGASTGGFTDCLLQHGARHVFAIDVGRGQLAWTLRNDARVTVMERTNVRMLAAGALDPVPDLCVVDVSFISLRTVAPHLLDLTAPRRGLPAAREAAVRSGPGARRQGRDRPRPRRARRRRRRSRRRSRRARPGRARIDRVADHRRRRQRRVPRVRASHGIRGGPNAAGCRRSMPARSRPSSAGAA